MTQKFIVKQAASAAAWAEIESDSSNDAARAAACVYKVFQTVALRTAEVDAVAAVALVVLDSIVCMRELKWVENGTVLSRAVFIKAL